MSEKRITIINGFCNYYFPFCIQGISNKKLRKSLSKFKDELLITVYNKETDEILPKKSFVEYWAQAERESEKKSINFGKLTLCIKSFLMVLS